MQLVIVGSGSVGKAIYSNAKRNGIRTLIASRNPDSADHLIDRNDLISLDNIAEAGDAFLLALPAQAAIDFAASVENWQGKILIDATNPLLPGLEGLSLGTTTSAGEAIAAAAPTARVVKAFNTTGSENLGNPERVADPIFTPICSDDEGAKQEVIALATSLGFDAVDFGALKTARYTEAFAMTWIHYAIKKQHGRDWAFSRSFASPQ